MPIPYQSSKKETARTHSTTEPSRQLQLFQKFSRKLQKIKWLPFRIKTMYWALLISFFKLVFVNRCTTFCHWKYKEKIDQTEFVTTAFLDLSKAFDSVPHWTLLTTLRELNLNKVAFPLIQSSWTGKNQKVMLNNCKSDWIERFPRDYFRATAFRHLCQSNERTQ